MKNIYTTLFIALAQLAFAQGSWQQVWSEEFDYTGLPHSDRWSYDEGCGVTNNELQYYAKERLKNTRVAEGSLVIEAHKEDLSGCAYTSGRIKSQYKGDWQYGKFEVRAKIPAFRGSWPAIWFLPTDSEYGGWPKSGEIDLMENVGFEPNKAYFTIHTEAYNHQINTQIGANTTVNDLSADYHTYTLIWSPDSLEMFLDQNKHFVHKRVDNDYKKWPFNKPFFILLNLAIGGDWAGAQGIDDTKFPAQFLVDYVRAYQWQTSAGPYVLTVPASQGTVSRNPDKATYTANETVTLTATPHEGYAFVGWQSDFYSSSNPLTLTVNRDLTIKPVFQKIGELVRNGDFENKSRYWNFNNYGTAKATFTVADQAAHIQVTTANATTPWEVQWIQNDIPLIKGHTYQFSFDASASTSMPVVANVGLNQDPWTRYTTQNVTAGATKSTYTKTFTMSIDDPAARISFDLGKAAGTVHLSNISLVDLTVSAVEEVIQDHFFQVLYDPTSQKLNLVASEGLSSVQVFNTAGVLLYEQQGARTTEASFHISGHPFIIKAVDPQGHIQVQKLKYELK